MKSPSLVLILSALVVAGCARSPRDSAEQRLRKVDPARLRAEAAVLYKNLFASEAATYTVIKSSAWPATFRAIEPLQVGAYRDGFALATHRDAGVESGLYVLPAQMDVVPVSKGRARFDRVADGIYWYSFQP